MEKDRIRRLLYDLEAPSRRITLSDLLEPLAPTGAATGSYGFGSLRDSLWAAPPAPPRAQSGIRFGDRIFSEPVSFGAGWLPLRPGLYAILIPDSRCTPRPYRVIYFGKAQNLSERVTYSHEKFSDWQRAAGFLPLYIAHCAMQNSSDLQRSMAEDDLICRYTPECNIASNPLNRWLRGEQP